MKEAIEKGTNSILNLKNIGASWKTNAENSRLK